MLDFVTDYIATPFGPLQKLHRTMTHNCKYHETRSFNKAMTTDASCDSYIEYVLTCVENEPAWMPRHIRQQCKHVDNNANTIHT